MRIVSGRFGGRHLKSPRGMQTRPSQEVLREAFFNRHSVEGLSFLDLFAGSGAVGFEALSRGACSVVFVERSRLASACIRNNAQLLGCEREIRLIQQDVFVCLKRWSREAFDLIYADPPYDRGFGEKLLASLSLSQVLGTSTRVFVEESREVEVLPNSAWDVVDRRQYGKAYIQELRFHGR